jgi:hypothetical protein
MTTDTTADLTEPELLALLRAEIERLGWIDAAAKAWKIDPVLLTNFAQRGGFGSGAHADVILHALGFERVVSYRRKVATNG